MNRIAVVSMMKNEADIVESSIRHWAKFADKIYICDHKSTDRTHEILDLLKDEGLNLEISSFNRDEKIQAEITNQLINRAIDEGFDLILPLDADEFPIYHDGDYTDLLQHLQALDTNFSYRIFEFLHRFVEPDKNSDQFALSHTSLIAKNSTSNYMTSTKIIVGRKMFLKYDLQISQGNHNLQIPRVGEIPPNHPIAKSILVDQKIFYAHFAYRSDAQIISKRLIMWLNTILIATRYTSWSRTNEQFAQKFINGKFEMHDTSLEFVPADFSKYRDECTLLYSTGNLNPLRNLYMLAESFANTISRERILANRELVQIFIFFDGDIECAIRSINSCIDQNYEFKEISVVLLTRQNVGELIFAASDNVSKFIPPEKLYDEILKSNGKYIQFVLAGDILQPNKILHQIEAMHSNLQPLIIFSDVELPQNFSHEFFKPMIEIPYLENNPIFEVEGINIVYSLLKDSGILVSALSRGLFAKNLFDKTLIDSLTESLTLNDCCVEVASIFFIATLQNRIKWHFLNEELVERGCRNWNESDLALYRNLCRMILEKLE